MAQRRFGYKWSGFWIGSEIRKPNHWKSRKNGCHFVKNHLKSGRKCPDFKWSGFQMFGSGYSYSQTLWKLDHSKSDHQKVWISNVSGFWKVRFQIPPVYPSSRVNILCKALDALKRNSSQFTYPFKINHIVWNWIFCLHMRMDCRTNNKLNIIKHILCQDFVCLTFIHSCCWNLKWN